MIYYLPAFLLYLLSAVFYFGDKKYRSWLGIIWSFFCIYVTFIIGYRFKVGSDWDSYLLLFNDREYNFADSGIAFFVIKSLIKSTSLGFQSYVLLMFIISFVVKVIAFKRITDKFFVCLLLYFSFWYLTYEANGIKQGAALGFTLLGVYYTIKRNLKAYILCIFLAFCFHNSAIIFLPFYWLTKICIRKVWVYSLIGIAIVFSYLGIGEVIIQLFTDSFVDSYFAQKTISYAVDEAYNNNVLLSFTSIHKIAILVIVLEISVRYGNNDELKNIFVWAACLSCLVYFLLSQFEVIATRLSLYYRIVEVVALSYIPFIQRKGWPRLLILTILFIYSLFQIWNVLQIEDGGLFPYQNYFMNETCLY